MLTQLGRNSPKTSLKLPFISMSPSSDCLASPTFSYKMCDSGNDLLQILCGYKQENVTLTPDLEIRRTARMREKREKKEEMKSGPTALFPQAQSPQATGSIPSVTFSSHFP